MPAIIMENRDNAYFLIPALLVDRYIISATHTQLKVILWLLKNSEKTTDELELSRYLDISVKELNDAILFWEKEGVLVKHGQRLSLNVGRITLTDTAPSYSGEVIADRIKNDKKLSFMLEKAEQIFSKLLSSNDVATLYSLYEWRGLSADVILMVVEYCVSSGKIGMRYIEKTAISWQEEGIDTLEKAENKIKTLQYKKTLEAKIVSIIGAGGRALTESEKKNISTWTIDYNFETDMIKRAYELTIEKTGKYSIGYMNTILRSWNEKGYKTLKEAENEPSSTFKKKNKEASYDLNDSFQKSWDIVHNDKN